MLTTGLAATPASAQTQVQDAASPGSASAPASTSGAEASAPAAQGAAQAPAQPNAPANAAPAPQGDSGGIVVAGRGPPPPTDPARALNLKSYAVVEGADKLMVGPAAHTYERGLPTPLRDGFHNAIYNLREPANAVNYMLQHRVGKSLAATARFAINSTVGLAGFFDVAKRKPFRIPYRPNGMADTLAYYGVKQGPYMFLPIIGPTTVRDLVGTTIDRFWFPLVAGFPLDTFEFGIAMTVVNGLDDRTRIDPLLRKFREESGDPYTAHREFYLKRRQAEIDGLHKHPRNAPELAPPPPFVPAPVPEAAPAPAPATPEAAPAPAPAG